MELLNILATKMEVPHILAALIGLPSALIYTLELFLLCKHWRRFDSSFFFLFSIRAIISLVNFFFSYLNQRFLRFGWFLPIYQSSPPFLLAIAYFFIYYPFHVENLITFFLLLNRLTSVAWPLRHPKLWNWSATLFCAFFAYFLPLLFTLHMVQYKAYVLLTNGSYVITYPAPTEIIALVYGQKLVDRFYLSNTFVMAASSILFTLICSAINIHTLILYRRVKRQQIVQQKNAGNLMEMYKNRTEMKLTVYAMATFMGQLLISFYMIIWYFVSTPVKFYVDTDTYYAINLAVLNQGPWVNDLCTIALPAWLMLWANEKMAKYMKRIFGIV